MKNISLRARGIEGCVEEAVAVLRRGGVILYPTDTVYGLGGDALSTEVVDKILRIKDRDASGKHMLAIASDMDMIAQYAEVNEVAKVLARHFFPGPLTLVMKKIAGEMGIQRGIETIAIRVPQNDFCLALTRVFDGLVISTSANKSGEPVGATVDEILQQLGDAGQGIDLVIDAGALSGSTPSTVVDVSEGEVRILREGAISKEAIFAVLRA